MTATNAGPDGATGTTLTDTLPSGESFVSATSSQGTCSQTAGTVTCHLGTVGSAASATVTITVTPTTIGPLADNATVSADQSDPNPANNTASAPVNATVPPTAADLSLTNSVAPSPGAAGQPLTYTLTATNAGPATATSVTVSDTLPPNTSFVSATPSQGLCGQASGTVACLLGDVAKGATATVTLVLTPAAAGSVTDQAVVSANQSDPNTANNVAAATVTVNPAADLGLSQSVAPSTAVVGYPETFTLTAVNNGPSASTGTTVTETLPAGTAFLAATPGQGSCGLVSTTLTCTLGVLAPGASAQIGLTITPLGTGTGTLTNTATISGHQLDPVSANNTSSQGVPLLAVGATADLAIALSAPPTATLGTAFTYTVSVTNNGPATATNVVATDTLPASVGQVSATPTSGTCSQAGLTLTCALGSIAQSAGAAVDIAVTPAGSFGLITDTASVAGGQDDPVPANNSATALTMVGAASSPYTAYVTNNGSTTVTPVTFNGTTGTAGTAITVAASVYGITNAPNSLKAYVVNSIGKNSDLYGITYPSTSAGASRCSGTSGQRVPRDVVITPNGTTAYVPSFAGTTVLPVNLATNTAGTAITVGATGAAPLGVAVTPDGRTVYVVNTGFGTVVPISTATNYSPAERRSSVGAGAQFIAIAPNGQTAYVTNNLAGTVIPINLSTGALGVFRSRSARPLRGSRSAPTGRPPTSPTPAPNNVTPISLASGTPGTCRSASARARSAGRHHA